MRNLPRGWIRLIWTADSGGEIPNPAAGKIVYTSRFSTRKCTIPMCQNGSISFSADLGVAKINQNIWPKPGIIMTCRIHITGFLVETVVGTFWS